ncbi:MAG: fatty acid desaturase family protein [Solirubrobacteraceae bacterium]
MNLRINLSEPEIEALGDEFDELRGRVIMDLGQRDAEYIRRVIKAQRALEVAGRGLLFAGFLPPAWLGGTAAPALSKILDNMEVGHNVMPGQYDWMKDPALDSKRFEWDTACPGDQWRHSRNYMHHTHTNVLGKDRDIGYGILRMSEDQPWRPRDIGNPVYATLLAGLFQWGEALHDLEIDRIESGEIELSDKRDILRAVWLKGRRQVLKDYVVFPLLAGPGAPFVLAGNLTANFTRNPVVVRDHLLRAFPRRHARVHRAGGRERDARRLVRPADARVGKPDRRAPVHLLSGNLSHQIEHDLFPDIPAHRYAEIAVEVREICERYGLPYNTGPLHKQFGSVVKKIVRLALPRRSREAHADLAVEPLEPQRELALAA